jgi:hypothetical protein
MASILAARKLAQYDGGKQVPATMSAMADALRWAEEIMREIDSPLACEVTRLTPVREAHSWTPFERIASSETYSPII